MTDHLNTVRDLAQYDPGTDTTTVLNHLAYNAFGEVTSETNAAVDSLFLFTARPFDEDTGLQNNLNRWYDPAVGRWLSEDPIGFVAADVNLNRYVGNRATVESDPEGEQWNEMPDGLGPIYPWPSFPGIDPGWPGLPTTIPTRPRSDWECPCEIDTRIFDSLFENVDVVIDWGTDSPNPPTPPPFPEPTPNPLPPDDSGRPEKEPGGGDLDAF